MLEQFEQKNKVLDYNLKCKMNIQCYKQLSEINTMERRD